MIPVKGEAKNSPKTCRYKSDEECGKGNEEIGFLTPEGESKAQDLTTGPVSPNATVDRILVSIIRRCRHSDWKFKE
jgi:hypothetical protein